VRNITQDPFFDSNPSWSPDGKQILYDRRIGPHSKVFLTDSDDPSRKVQLTFGESDDIQPSFSRDAKTVYYVSDVDGEIYNVHTLSLETGDIARLTSLSGGAFTPTEIQGDGGVPGVVYAAYTEGRLRVYRMTPTEPDAVIRASDQAREPAELEPFEPPLRLSLDTAAMKPYDKIHYHIENAPSVYVGVADDGTFLGSAQVLLSDLLGDNRMYFDFQTVSTFSNFFFRYDNLKNRWNWGAYARDFRDYYVVQSVNTGAVARERQASSTTSGGAFISYPFNRYYRVSGAAGYTTSSYTRPDFNFFPTQFFTVNENYPTVGWAIDGDTTRFKSFGPYHGQRFSLSMQWAPTASVSGDVGNINGSFLNTGLDYRLYRRITDRSLFALRLGTYVSQGDLYSIYSLGGLNYLRGYDYREFYGSRASFLNMELRFPLLDALAFPIGVLRDIRGFFFFDLGTAWFQNDIFTHSRLGTTVSASDGGRLLVDSFGRPVYLPDQNGVFVTRRFDFWDSKNNKLGDGRAAYGFGFNIWLGPFQLTWVYARQMDNTVETCNVGPDFVCDRKTELTRVDDPTGEGGTVGQFYISTDF
jgi:WD40 repeat protein